MQMLPCDRKVCAAAVLLTSVGAARAACPPAWLPQGYVSCEVRALLRLPSGDFVAGGRFGRAGSFRANGVARYDGAQWQSFGAGVLAPSSELCVDERVSALAHYGGSVVAGGEFADLRHLAFFDGAAWRPLGGGIIGSAPVRVNALAIGADGALYVAGRFGQTGLAYTSNIARWNGDWAALGSGINGEVLALCTSAAGDLIAGGVFTSAGGAPALNIARWDGSMWAPLGLGCDAGVRALAATADGILVGGDFETAGGARTPRLAHWNGAVWRPVGSTGSSIAQPGTYVAAVTQDEDGSILVGGALPFYMVPNWQPVARWDGAVWSAPAVGLGGTVLALLPASNGFIAGGAFAATVTGTRFLTRFQAEIPGEDPPTITASPASSSTCSGLLVTLSAGASAAAPLTYKWEVEMAGVWLPLTLGRQTPSGGYLVCSNPQSAQTSVRMFGARAAETLRFRAVVSAACLSVATEVAEVSFVPLLGDIDSSGAVDMADLVVLLSSYGNVSTLFGPGDLNGDGRVDFIDLSQFLAEYGRSCGS